MRRLRGGDTAGIIALIVLGIICIAALVGFGLGSLTGSPFLTAALAFICPVGAAYLFYQSRRFSLYLGFCGLMSYWAASFTYGAIANSFFAYMAAAVSAVVVFAVLVYSALVIFYGKFGDKPWRTRD